MKNRLLHSRILTHRCKPYILILAFLWLAGMVLGIILSYRFPGKLPFLLKQAASGFPTSAGYAVTLILPFSLCALFSFLSLPLLLWILAFFKAVCSGYCLAAAVIAFGDCSWLIHSLLCFTDLCANGLLVWFIVRRMNPGDSMIRRDVMRGFLFLAIVCTLDFTAITPLLSSVLQYS